MAKLVVVALVEVEFSAVKFCSVEEPLERMLPKVPSPDAERVVIPVNAPLVTSHESELTLMVSPPSPMVRVPVVVSVPEIELLPMTPPESVSASDT